MKTVAIAQARMGSTRLPGKVMRKIGGHPVLEWTVRTLEHAKLVDQVVLATSKSSADDVIADWCTENKVFSFRGSENDVTGRFLGAAKHFSADIIIRVTCDCPFIDPAVVDQVIALRQAENTHYASNTWPPTWPDGLDVEVFTCEALVAADQFAQTPLDRDCLTQFIYRNRSIFRSATLACPIPGMEKERWVLDTDDDLKLCTEIANNFGDRWGFAPPTYLEIKKFLDTNPHLRLYNDKAVRNERFYDALATEKRPSYSFSRSGRTFARAKKVTPLPGQTFSKSWLQYPADHAPLFVSHGDGGYVFDVDGQRYVDLVAGLLPNVLGYCDPDVDYAVRSQLNSGISFSLATELEIELCEKLTQIIPCAEMVRLGKNGADATAGAVRLARGATGHDKIVLIEKGYHGWHDWSIGTTERNLGVPSENQLVTKRLPPNLDDIDRFLKDYYVAAVIIEPEFRTWGFLRELRLLCNKRDVILIFDEIISGFRWHLGGYQAYIDVTPDLATFGKAMANGMPISAIVGSKDLMQRFAPPDNVFYSGTFFGETLSIAAALATIQKIERENVIEHLWKQGNILMQEMQKAVVYNDLEQVVQIDGIGPRVRIDFKCPESTKLVVAAIFRQEMIKNGVLVIGSNNICFAHGKPEIDRCARAYTHAFAKIAEIFSTGKALGIPAIHAGVR